MMRPCARCGDAPEDCACPTCIIPGCDALRALKMLDEDTAPVTLDFCEVHHRRWLDKALQGVQQTSEALG